jgi:hypothetical protein
MVMAYGYGLEGNAMTKTATRVKTLTEEFGGNAALYRVDPPLPVYSIEDENETYEYVIVSAVNNGYAHETYIFPAREDGTLVSWGEMPGSQRDTTSHDEVLSDLGYDVIGG